MPLVKINLPEGFWQDVWIYVKEKGFSTVLLIAICILFGYNSVTNVNDMKKENADLKSEIRVERVQQHARTITLLNAMADNQKEIIRILRYENRYNHRAEAEATP